MARKSNAHTRTANEVDTSMLARARDGQHDAALRIQQRDFELHTGGNNFIRRMEEIMRPKPLED